MWLYHPPHKGWLGASPDGHVTDESAELPHGIVEIKCPYSKREMMPEEVCGDSLFRCEVVDADICLKPTHICISIKFSCSYTLVRMNTIGVTSVFLPVKE